MKPVGFKRLNLLLCMLPDDEGWLQKHVGGIKKLYFLVYCTCVLWFKYNLIAPDE
jgi:hypothetical protein